MSIPVAAVAIALPGQGEFVNFETPQVKPITVATVGTGAAAHDYLLVCNTPDNSLEVYDASSPYTFVKRVPVGLRPVTVRVRTVTSGQTTTHYAYVVNFLGDSVTMVRLDPPTSQNALMPVVLSTTDVGDEPCDIVFHPVQDVAFVSLNRDSSIAWRVASTMAPIATLPLMDSSTPGLAVKQPRAMEILPDGRHITLNFMGDNKPLYDLDVLLYDPLPAPGMHCRLGSMGTTHHSLAISGESPPRMFVVGTLANNLGSNGLPRPGLAQVSALPTGFVESHLWVVNLNNSGTPPTLVPEAQPGATAPTTFQSINLNQDYGNSTATVDVAVSKSMALSQPTDVVLWEGTSGVEKVFVTAYHSDLVAMLEPDATNTVHGGWKITRIFIPTSLVGNSYRIAGPRGLAVSRTATDPGGSTSPGLVYCATRLDNSFTVIDPHLGIVLFQQPLGNDPTPNPIRFGRQFLYGAHLSGNGAVSCASCHIDGRTDALQWDLGTPGNGPAINSWYHDGNEYGANPLANFPPNKGTMVTQTLQGLVNFPVNRPGQWMFTNAPYHWRGDKPRLEDFNEAFVNLQKSANVGSTTDPKGLSDGDMSALVDFVNTIHHPPNPEQPADRVPKGSFGGTTWDFINNPFLTAGASGALWGQKLFHLFPVVADGRSCVHCHTLPDGSSNTSTLAFTVLSSDPNHPFETAALRNLEQREGLLQRNFTADSGATAVTRGSGLLNAGPVFNINSFIAGSQSPFLSPLFSQAMAEAVTEYVRQFDTGVGPSVGDVVTVQDKNDVSQKPILDRIEAQVLDNNCGLAVYTRDNAGIERGYYFDATLSPPAYRLEGTATIASRQVVKNHAGTGSEPGVAIFQATEVGSERRVASLSGQVTRLTGPSMGAVTLEEMSPATHNLVVPLFESNWDPAHPALPFAWQGGAIPTPPSLKSMRTFQTKVWGMFGVPALTYNTVPVLRHEPPRRFRVTEQNDNIRHGARLFLGVPLGAAKSLPVEWLIVDLFPTGYSSGGKKVWETTVELDGLMTMALMHGGPAGDGVLDVLQNRPPSKTLNPGAWNWFLVMVWNEDNTWSTPSWHPIRIRDTR